MILDWMYHFGPWLALILVLGAIFTNGFGLLGRGRSKGNWYKVSLESIPEVALNLYKNNAFIDSEGLPNSEDVRIIPTYAEGSVYFRYEIYVPDYCLAKVERTLALEMLGIVNTMPSSDEK